MKRSTGNPVVNRPQNATKTHRSDLGSNTSNKKSTEKLYEANRYFPKNSSTRIAKQLEPPNECPQRDPPLDEPKTRSKSTVIDRKPWGQLLNKHHLEMEPVFGRCDPFRTLHFLSKELQFHLPEEGNVQEIIKAMNAALRRIPPEVASSVQLESGSRQTLSASEESLDVLCTSKKSKSQDYEDIQKLIESSTMKLEASCKHLENICGQLRDEKVTLEHKLESERTQTSLLQRRVEDVELDNKKLVQSLDDKTLEVLKLKSQLAEAQQVSSDTDSNRTLIADLRKSKTQLEQQNMKLQHQLRLFAMEKEKFQAILTVRDRQIHEIRTEMTQLQNSVNEQLLNLHRCAVATGPDEDKENRGETLSSVFLERVSEHSFESVDSDDDRQLPTKDVFKVL